MIVDVVVLVMQFVEVAIVVLVIRDQEVASNQSISIATECNYVHLVMTS